MENEIQFKYNPYWLFPVSLLASGIFGVIFYFFADTIRTQDYKFLPAVAIPFLLIGALALYILRMLYNCVNGIPAIVLTKESLISNNLNVQIPYEDIIDVTIRNNPKNTMLGLNLNEPNKYFNTPIKRLLRKLNSAINPDDFSINLDFVKGDNNSILEAINQRLDHANYSQV